MKKQFTKTIGELFLITMVFFAVSLPTIVLAQNNNDYKLLAPIPGFDETYKTGDIGKYVNAIIKLAIVVSTVLAVVMITLGGFQYMTSESMGLKQEGKDKIKNAFLGLVILASSFLILNTINPALLNFNLNIQTVGVPGNASQPQINTTAPQLTQGEQEATTQSGRTTLGEGLNLGAFPANERDNRRNAYRTNCENSVAAGGLGGVFVSSGGGNVARCYSE